MSCRKKHQTVSKQHLPKYFQLETEGPPKNLRVSSSFANMPLYRGIPCYSVFERNPLSLNDLQLAYTQNMIYEHQFNALKALYDRWNQRRERIATVSLPTGTGKSVVATLACYMMQCKNVLVITPSLIIMKQMHTSFCGEPNNWSKADVIDRDIFEEPANVLPAYATTIATSSQMIHELVDEGGRFRAIQTLLVANAQKFGPTSKNVNMGQLQQDFFDMIIVDEAHHYPAVTWVNIIDHFQSKCVLFMTATPNIDLQNTMCFDFSLEDAVRKNIIRSTRPIEVPYISPSVGVVETRRQKNQKAMEQVAERIKLELLQQQPSYKAMILVRQTSEAYDVCHFLNQHYDSSMPIAAAYVAGTDEAVLAKFVDTRSTLRILVICNRLLEGFNCPHVSVVGIARHVSRSSNSLFAQFVGRAVRKVHNDPNDVAETIVVFSSHFNQSQNYENYVRPCQAIEDPSEDNDNDSDMEDV